MIYTIVLLDTAGAISEYISFDCVNSLSESYRNQIAVNPVEAGQDLTDNSTVTNDTFSLSGVITDSLFRKSGGLVKFVNGKFELDGAVTQGVNTEKPLIYLRDRLIRLRNESTFFGILESEDSNNLSGSRIRLIYPCQLESLDFKTEDASSAIYPNMSFQRVRVSTTSFRVEAKATPLLIPKVEKTDEGIGEVAEGTQDAIDSIIMGKKTAEEQTKLKASNDYTEIGKLQDQKADWINAKIAATEKYNAGLRSGSISSSVDSEVYIQKELEKQMDLQYGDNNWNDWSK